MPTIETNNTRLYYEKQGDTEPLILVTGFAQTCQAWNPLIPALAEHFQTISVDNRGAGQSDASEKEYSIEIFSQDLIGLMDALKIESAHFMGQSMGSLIIQQLCILHPERVKRAVLCSPFAKLPSIAAHTIRCQLKMLQKGIDQNLLIELNAAWLLSNRFLSQAKNVEKFVQESISSPYPQSMEGLLGQAAALIEADLSHEIHRISHELLLLVGEQDIDTPPYCAKEISKSVANCKVHIFKEMGHLFTYEIPDQTAKQAIEFLIQK